MFINTLIILNEILTEPSNTSDLDTLPISYYIITESALKNSYFQTSEIHNSWQKAHLKRDSSSSSGRTWLPSPTTVQHNKIFIETAKSSLCFLLLTTESQKTSPNKTKHSAETKNQSIFSPTSIRGKIFYFSFFFTYYHE